MSPPAKKKRKTAAGSVPVGARRSTRSQRPGLSTEMISKVATFANYDGGDLMNICLAVGPKESAVVRYTCLRKNYRYLRHVLKRIVSAEEEIAANAKAGSDIRAWMAINTDWRDDPVVGRATLEDAEGALSTVEGAASTVVRDGDVTRISARIIFLNPAVAIEFGLVDVLRHLVETVGIDVNACKWNNYARDTQFHLLIQAVLHEESACLDYLLSTEKIDMNSNLASDRNHALKCFILGYDEMPNEHFRAIVRYPTFGVNAPMNVSGNAMSPLVFMCVSAGTGEEPMTPRHMELIQIFLDEGADPMLQMGDTPSPLVVAAQGASEDDSSEVRAGWKKILRMMEEKVESSE